MLCSSRGVAVPAVPTAVVASIPIEDFGVLKSSGQSWVWCRTDVAKSTGDMSLSFVASTFSDDDVSVDHPCPPLFGLHHELTATS